MKDYLQQYSLNISQYLQLILKKTKAILQAQIGVTVEIKTVLMIEAHRAPKVPDAAATEPKSPGFLAETCSIINTPPQYIYLLHKFLVQYNLNSPANCNYEQWRKSRFKA